MQDDCAHANICAPGKHRSPSPQLPFGSANEQLCCDVTPVQLPIVAVDVFAGGTSCDTTAVRDLVEATRAALMQGFEGNEAADIIVKLINCLVGHNDCRLSCEWSHWYGGSHAESRLLCAE